jgi:mRNA interferase MazF
MPKPGDLVLVDFVGATGVKRRPSVVVSSDLYHLNRPDIILGVVTSNIASAKSPTDHLIQDWAKAGLRSPSAFRAYFGMALPTKVRKAGELSSRDFEAILACIRLAFGT